MTTIPPADRDAARQRLLPLLPYISRGTYREIQDELKNTTTGTIHQVAIGKRWTLDIFEKLVEKGKANKDKIVSLSGAAASSDAPPTDGITNTNDAAKTPKNGQKSKGRKKGEKQAAKE